MLAEVIGNVSGSFKVRERFLLARNLSLSLLQYMSNTWGIPSATAGGFVELLSPKASTIFKNAIDQPFQAEIT